MSVSSTNTFLDFAGNGTSDTFVITFEFILNAHLSINLIDNSTGDKVEWDEGIDYTVAGGNPGTGITAITPPATGFTLHIERVTPTNQGSSLGTGQAYQTATVEAVLDKLALLEQEINCKADRSVKLNLLDGLSFDPTLEQAEADCIITWNPTADGLINGPTVSQISGLVDDAEAAAAAALVSETNAALSAAASAISAAAALVSELAAAVSAAAALASENAAAASASAAAASAGGLTGTVTIDLFTGDDVTTVFNLSVDPGTENNTQVFISGVYQQKSTYSVAGTVLTFATAPWTDVANNIEVVISAIIFGVPSDDSVSTIKIQDGAVTSAKITRNVRSVLVADAGLVTDDFIVANPTAGGSFIFTMPAAGTVPAGQELTIKNITAGANYVRLKGNGAELLDGVNTYATDLLSMDSTTWVCDGSQWLRVA